MIGVSGGGGLPLVALVVDVEAVDANRFISFFGVGATKFGFLAGSPLSSEGPGIGGG